MSFINRIKNLDWILLLAILFLGTASLVSLYKTEQEFYRQVIWFAVALVVIFIVSQIDWRSFVNYSWGFFGLYIFSIFLLIITFFIAPTIHGTKGWLVMGPLQFQTAELAKLALIVVLSAFWARGHVGVAHIKNLLKSFLYFIFPAMLIMIQPDMGSVLVLFVIWFGYLLISGIKWKHLIVALLIIIILGTISWSNFLKDYQKNRILDFVNPGRDPLGVSYNVIQSKIAIGSAGLLGKGFGQGTQTRLGFLPEYQTDFIFASFIEEWGLIGGILVILAFLIVLVRIIRIGLVSENNFFKLFCLGSVVMFLSHFILNAGSNIGFVPVVGIPFPFFSYGGSHILTGAFIVGIIQSVSIRSR